MGRQDRERTEPTEREDRVAHVVVIAGLRAEPSSASTVGRDLAEAHDAQLTLVSPLAPLSRVLPTGAEAIAQREEYEQIRSRLKRRVQVARLSGVRARGSIRVGDRVEALAAEVEDGGSSLLVVAPAARARGTWDWFSGRRLERVAQLVRHPVLGVHEGDSLDPKARLRVVVVHRSRPTCVDAVCRAARLVAVDGVGRSFSLHRVGGDADPERELGSTADEIARRGFDLSGDAVVVYSEAEQLDALRRESADLVVVAADAPRRPWPFRGALARLAPRVDSPVLAL
jgi:hypothetical protein